MVSMANSRLKKRIAQRGMTYRNICELTGIPLGSLCSKINCYAQFSSREASLLGKTLDISTGKFHLFF